MKLKLAILAVGVLFAGRVWAQDRPMEPDADSVVSVPPDLEKAFRQIVTEYGPQSIKAKIAEQKREGKQLQPLAPWKPVPSMESVLAKVPKKDRVTVILSLLLETKDLPESRSDLAGLFFHEPIDKDWLRITHLPLLAEAYLFTVNEPSPIEPRVRSFIDDFSIQSQMLWTFAVLLNVSAERNSIEFTDHTPKDWLRQLFLIAEKKNPDPKLAAQIKECLRLLERDENEVRSEPPENKRPALTETKATQSVPSPKAPSRGATEQAVHMAEAVPDGYQSWVWVGGCVVLAVLVVFLINRRAP